MASLKRWKDLVRQVFSPVYREAVGAGQWLCPLVGLTSSSQLTRKCPAFEFILLTQMVEFTWEDKTQEALSSRYWLWHTQPSPPSLIELHQSRVKAPVEALADIFSLLPRCHLPPNCPLMVLCPILYFKHILTQEQARSYLTPIKFQVASLSLRQGSP